MRIKITKKNTYRGRLVYPVGAKFEAKDMGAYYAFLHSSGWVWKRDAEIIDETS